MGVHRWVQWVRARSAAATSSPRVGRGRDRASQPRSLPRPSARWATNQRLQWWRLRPFAPVGRVGCCLAVPGLAATCSSHSPPPLPIPATAPSRTSYNGSLSWPAAPGSCRRQRHRHPRTPPARPGPLICSLRAVGNLQPTSSVAACGTFETTSVHWPRASTRRLLPRGPNASGERRRSGHAGTRMPWRTPTVALADSPCTATMTFQRSDADARSRPQRGLDSWQSSIVRCRQQQRSWGAPFNLPTRWSSCSQPRRRRRLGDPRSRARIARSASTPARPVHLSRRPQAG